MPDMLYVTPVVIIVTLVGAGIYELWKRFKD